MSTQRKYYGFVVSETHWDRAWYLPFQQFRIKLVRLMDNLLELLKDKEKFHAFTLDGQAIILDDYLEIRPEKAKEIEKLVNAGKLLIGPFYTLPDEFLVSGESLIRNILIGHLVSERFGKVMKVGYNPDAFGHISQLPQILKGFNIDSAIFTRGTGDEIEKAGNIFKWLAPDNETWVLGIVQLGGYCNMAGWGVPDGYPIDTINIDYEKALKRLLDKIKEMEKHKLVTNNLLFNNGCDHYPAQPLVPEIINYVNQHQKLCYLRHSTFKEYVDAIKNAKPSLVTYQGELHEGKIAPILSGTFSSRIHIRQKNFEVQNLLEQLAEPVSVWHWLQGSKYPQEILLFAWKTLLKSHPHDDICGSSIDETHRDTMTYLIHAGQIAQILAKEGWGKLVNDINTKTSFPGEAVIVYNPTNWTASPEIKINFDDTSKKYKTKNIDIIDGQGNPINSKLAISSTNGKDYIKGSFLAENIPPYGYKTFYITTGREKPRRTSLKLNPRGMENEFYKIKFNKNGTINIFDKETNAIFENCNLFEDIEDAGDEYDYSPIKGNGLEIITNKRLKSKVKIGDITPHKISFLTHLEMSIPYEISRNRKSRSNKKVFIPITSEITLYKGIKRIDFSTTIDNKAKDHRMRVIFPTLIKTDFVFAESKFDVIRRPIEIPKVKNYCQKPIGTNHQDNFIDVNDGEIGFALFNKGLPEYEVKSTKNGVVIYQTLFRGVGWLSRYGLLTRYGSAGPMIETPDAQCLGINTYHYSIMPHSGDWQTAKVYKFARIYNSLFISHICPQKEGKLPATNSFIKLEPDNLIITAIKKAEKGNSLIIRFYNVIDEKVDAVLTFYKEIKGAYLVNLNEERIEELNIISGNSLKIPALPKKIITIEIEPIQAPSL